MLKTMLALIVFAELPNVEYKGPITVTRPGQGQPSYADIFQQQNPWDALGGSTGQPGQPAPAVPASQANPNDAIAVLDQTLDGGSQIAASVGALTLFNANGSTLRLMAGQLAGPVKNGWISGWIDTIDTAAPVDPSGQSAPAVGLDVIVTFVWGTYQQGNASSMRVDLGKGFHFSFPCNHLEVYLTYIGTFFPGPPPASQFLRGGMGQGRREGTYRHTLTFVSDPTPSGSVATFSPPYAVVAGTLFVQLPPYAKSVAIYRQNPTAAFNVVVETVISSVVVGAYNLTVPVGQNFVSFDLAAGAYIISIVNTGPGADTYFVIFGLDT